MFNRLRTDEHLYWRCWISCHTTCDYAPLHSPRFSSGDLLSKYQLVDVPSAYQCGNQYNGQGSQKEDRGRKPPSYGRKRCPVAQLTVVRPVNLLHGQLQLHRRQGHIDCRTNADQGSDKFGMVRGGLPTCLEVMPFLQENFTSYRNQIQNTIIYTLPYARDT